MPEQTQITIPAKSDTEPYNQEVFETYVVWKSIPAFFKYPPKDKKTGFQPEPRQYAEQIGLDDESILDLVTIRTQADFARRFELSPDTLTDWNKIISKQDSLAPIREWARFLTKNIVSAIYQHGIKSGDPRNLKLFLQVVEGWEEKSRVQLEQTAPITFEIITNDISAYKPPEDTVEANTQADAGV